MRKPPAPLPGGAMSFWANSDGAIRTVERAADCVACDWQRVAQQQHADSAKHNKRADEHEQFDRNTRAARSKQPNQRLTQATACGFERSVVRTRISDTRAKRLQNRVHDTLIVGEYLTARTVSLFPSRGRPINGRIGDDSAVPASQALNPKRKPKIE